jgi:glycosyltransferase involved in cell wall biosynthesis
MNNGSRMLLTVLTPTLNCAATLRQTLSSIAALEERLPGQLQHLIGDAGSTDGTAELLQAHCNQHPWATLAVLKACGVPATLNTLMKSARGHWIVVLNGDDTFDTDALSCLLGTIHVTNTPLIICGDVAVYSADGCPLGERGCRLDKLDEFMAVNHPAMLVERSVFDLVGPFDVSTPRNYDYVWTWRAFRAGINFIHYPKILAHARLGGISARHAKEAAREIRRVKMAEGEIMCAMRAYIPFAIKRYARAVLPAKTANKLTAVYRELRGSIDRY